MSPGEISNFKIDFIPKKVYSTIYELLSQFKTEKIKTFEIEIYGYTCTQDKISLFFKNTEIEWSAESFDIKKCENFIAIIKEHCNEELFFNVLFYLPPNRMTII